jgi:hypothetical protein
MFPFNFVICGHLRTKEIDAPTCLRVFCLQVFHLINTSVLPAYEGVRMRFRQPTTRQSKANKRPFCFTTHQDRCLQRHISTIDQTNELIDQMN